MYTKQMIAERIDKNQEWFERAILAIYDRQTSDEKMEQETKHSNNRGFNKPDGYKLAYYAKWIRSGKHLSGWHLNNAKVKMHKYVGQLTRIANKEE